MVYGASLLQRRTGRRAAWVSFTRFVRVVWGADLTRSGSSSASRAIDRNASDEQIEFAFAFGFGRLDHQRTVNDQRKAHRVGVEPVIN